MLRGLGKVAEARDFGISSGRIGKRSNDFLGIRERLPRVGEIGIRLRRALGKAGAAKIEPLDRDIGGILLAPRDHERPSSSE